jgi:ribonuclease HI
MNKRPSPLLLITDGASSGNPGPSGWAAIVLTPDGEVTELGGRRALATNNQMELTAVIEALRWISRDETYAKTPAQVYTDSTYVIKGITEWLPAWEKREWTTTTGKPIANVDLWQDLSQLVDERKITWHFVKGHSGIPANDRADQIAVDFSLRKTPALYTGHSKNYSLDLLDLLKKDPLGDYKKAKSQPKRSGIPYSYLSVVKHIPMRHSDWKSCETRVKGQSGARFKKAMTADEEIEILKAWGFGLGDLR